MIKEYHKKEYIWSKLLKKDSYRLPIEGVDPIGCYGVIKRNGKDVYIFPKDD